MESKRSLDRSRLLNSARYVEHVLEHDGVVQELIDHRGRRTPVAIASEMVGAQRIDDDEEEIGAGPFATQQHEES